MKAGKEAAHKPFPSGAQLPRGLGVPARPLPSGPNMCLPNERGKTLDRLPGHPWEQMGGRDLGWHLDLFLSQAMLASSPGLPGSWG